MGGVDVLKEENGLQMLSSDEIERSNGSEAELARKLAERTELDEDGALDEIRRVRASDAERVSADQVARTAADDCGQNQDVATDQLEIRYAPDAGS